MPTQQLLEQTSMNPDFRFAAAVALFAQILQKSEYSGTGTLDTVLQLLQDSVGDDPQRKEFVALARQVKDAFVKQNNDSQPQGKP